MERWKARIAGASRRSQLTSFEFASRNVAQSRAMRLLEDIIPAFVGAKRRSRFSGRGHHPLSVRGYKEAISYLYDPTLWCLQTLPITPLALAHSPVGFSRLPRSEAGLHVRRLVVAKSKRSRSAPQRRSRRRRDGGPPSAGGSRTAGKPPKPLDLQGLRMSARTHRPGIMPLSPANNRRCLPPILFVLFPIYLRPRSTP